jgi:hypothetical protein
MSYPNSSQSPDEVFDIPTWAAQGAERPLLIGLGDSVQPHRCSCVTDVSIGIRRGTG